MMYPRMLESILLPAYDRARGRCYSQRRIFLEGSQWWTSDRLRAFQWMELKALLAHVFASVPYLREKYRNAGIAWADLRSWDDFRRLPPLTRARRLTCAPVTGSRSCCCSRGRPRRPSWGSPSG